MRATRTRRGLAGLGLALAVGVGVSGCSLPDVGMSPSLSQAAHTTAAATSTAAEPTTEAAAATTRTSGDLDTGSVTHAIAAGDRTVVIDWWTDQTATHWTAAGDKTIQLSAHVEGGDADSAITVTRFLATADDGTSRTTVTEDRGEFVLTEPFSYSTALDVPASTAGASDLTLTVQFELLIETEPGSGAFFRQTVLDSIALPLLQKDTP